MQQWLAALAALASFTAAYTIHPRQDSACNNSPDLCSKSYSEVTHLGAHNSPFLRDESTGFSTSGNHYFSSTLQLSAGVRMLTGQVHRSNGEWHMCHSSCDLLDAGRLTDWLSEIKAWMDENPSDVVSILLVNSDNASPKDLAAEFDNADIIKYAFRPADVSNPPESWPTLQELIAADTRLMAFVASFDTNLIDDTTSFLMNEFTFIFETAFENFEAKDFSCIPDRPSGVKGRSEQAVSSGRLPLQNHFLYDKQLFGIEAPAEDKIGDTNAPAEKTGNIGDAAEQCQTEWGRAASFILVDFFDQGPAMATVDKLNGVTNPVGRASLPPRDQESNGPNLSSDLPSSLVDMVQRVRNGDNPSLGAWIWAGGDFGKTLGGWDPTGRDQ